MENGNDPSNLVPNRPKSLIISGADSEQGRHIILFHVLSGMGERLVIERAYQIIKKTN